MSSKLRDGYQTLVTFANYPTVKFYEMEVTPPGIEGGGPINQTTMHNTAWRTKWPKALKDLTPVVMTCEYDPDAFATTAVPDMIQENQLITLEFPDGDTIAFWGWVERFVPGPHVEGEKPTAEVEIQPSLLNGSEVETAPVHTS